MLFPFFTGECSRLKRQKKKSVSKALIKLIILFLLHAGYNIHLFPIHPVFSITITSARMGTDTTKILIIWLFNPHKTPILYS